MASLSLPADLGLTPPEPAEESGHRQSTYGEMYFHNCIEECKDGDIISVGEHAAAKSFTGCQYMEGHAEKNDADARRVTLDVGGTVFATSLATLRSNFGRNSWFGARFSGQFADPVEGPIFIDRDPTHFHLVLCFLREGWCALPENRQELRHLRAEAEFYSFADLLDLIDKSPTMLDFFQKLMVVSPEGDWQDREEAMPGSPEYRECQALSQIASESERFAALKCTRAVRMQVDATIMLRMSDHQIPAVLILTGSSLSWPMGEDEYPGRYLHCSGHGAHGYPVWKHEKRGFWLFTDTNGYWAFMAFSDIRDGTCFKTDMSMIRSKVMHNGMQPSKINSWMMSEHAQFRDEEGIRVILKED